MIHREMPLYVFCLKFLFWGFNVWKNKESKIYNYLGRHFFSRREIEYITQKELYTHPLLHPCTHTQTPTSPPHIHTQE